MGKKRLTWTPRRRKEDWQDHRCLSRRCLRFGRWCKTFDCRRRGWILFHWDSHLLPPLKIWGFYAFSQIMWFGVTSSQWHLHSIFHCDKVRVTDMLEAAASKISRSDSDLVSGGSWNETHLLVWCCAILDSAYWLKGLNLNLVLLMFLCSVLEASWTFQALFDVHICVSTDMLITSKQT